MVARTGVLVRARSDDTETLQEDSLAAVFCRIAMEHGYSVGNKTWLTPKECVSTFPRRSATNEEFFAMIVAEDIRVETVCELLRHLSGVGRRCQAFVVGGNGFYSPGNALSCARHGALATVRLDIEPSAAETIAYDIAAGRSPYPEFQLEGLVRLGSVFIATPYRYLANADCAGIREGLRALGVNPVMARETVARGEIGKNVQYLIEESDLIIVNVSEYGETWNPNVYWEFGYACGRTKPVIAIGRHNGTLPTNLQGTIWVPYHSPTELAQIIYYGLRHYKEHG